MPKSILLLSDQYVPVPQMAYSRQWPANGRLAATGDRWLIVCGDYRSEQTAPGTNSCEILDTKAEKMKWELIDNLPLKTESCYTAGMNHNWTVFVSSIGEYVYLFT